jgi:hypothetical protein
VLRVVQGLRVFRCVEPDCVVLEQHRRWSPPSGVVGTRVVGAPALKTASWRAAPTPRLRVGNVEGLRFARRVLRGIRVLAWIRGVKPSRARLEQHRRWSPASSDDPSEMVGGAGSQDRSDRPLRHPASHES